ncbi:MAG: hypothetical protein RL266_1477 [Bacteroidota bacterium]|jgi:hypothetical protein
MRFILFILLVCLSHFCLAHEGHQAFYKLTEENGQTILLVKMELPDIQTCLQTEQLCSGSQELNWCAATWVNNLVSIQVDGNVIDEEYESSYTESGHLVLRFSLVGLPESFKSLEVINLCFLGSFESYDNIFQVSLKGHNQGYKMNEKRTSIKIDFSNRS